MDFFVRFQYYLQAGIKLLLFNVMAEALSTVVDNTKAMREKPIKKVLKVLARKKDVNRILMSHRVDTLTNEIFLTFGLKKRGIQTPRQWQRNADRREAHPIPPTIWTRFRRSIARPMIAHWPLKSRKTDPRIWLPVKMTVKLQVRTEARFRWL